VPWFQTPLLDCRFSADALPMPVLVLNIVHYTPKRPEIQAKAGALSASGCGSSSFNRTRNSCTNPL
jgi:hypothetical protein